jgi:hypothetical protein
LKKVVNPVDTAAIAETERSLDAAELSLTRARDALAITESRSSAYPQRRGDDTNVNSCSPIRTTCSLHA